MKTKMFPNENRIGVNSVHMEGITRCIWELDTCKDMREVFRINAMAPDGVIEAVSAIGKSFFMGFQAHFEFCGEMHDRVYGYFLEKIDKHHLKRVGG